MSPGVEFAVVLAGGCVTTFFALAILEMIRQGRARRAQSSLDTSHDAQRVEAGLPPSMRQQTPEAMPVDHPGHGNPTKRQ